MHGDHDRAEAIFKNYDDLMTKLLEGVLEKNQGLLWAQAQLELMPTTLDNIAVKINKNDKEINPTSLSEYLERRKDLLNSFIWNIQDRLKLPGNALNESVKKIQDSFDNIRLQLEALQHEKDDKSKPKQSELYQTIHTKLASLQTALEKTDSDSTILSLANDLSKINKKIKEKSSVLSSEELEQIKLQQAEIQNTLQIARFSQSAVFKIANQAPSNLTKADLFLETLREKIATLQNDIVKNLNARQIKNVMVMVHQHKALSELQSRLEDLEMIKSSSIEFDLNKYSPEIKASPIWGYFKKAKELNINSFNTEFSDHPLLKYDEFGTNARGLPGRISDENMVRQMYRDWILTGSPAYYLEKNSMKDAGLPKRSDNSNEYTNLSTDEKRNKTEEILNRDFGNLITFFNEKLLNKTDATLKPALLDFCLHHFHQSGIINTAHMNLSSFMEQQGMKAPIAFNTPQQKVTFHPEKNGIRITTETNFRGLVWNETLEPEHAPPPGNPFLKQTTEVLLTVACDAENQPKINIEFEKFESICYDKRIEPFLPKSLAKQPSRLDQFIQGLMFLCRLLPFFSPSISSDKKAEMEIKIGDKLELLKMLLDSDQPLLTKLENAAKIVDSLRDPMIKCGREKDFKNLNVKCKNIISKEPSKVENRIKDFKNTVDKMMDQSEVKSDAKDLKQTNAQETVPRRSK